MTSKFGYKCTLTLTSTSWEVLFYNVTYNKKQKLITFHMNHCKYVYCNNNVSVSSKTTLSYCSELTTNNATISNFSTFVFDKTRVLFLLICLDPFYKKMVCFKTLTSQFRYVSYLDSRHPRLEAAFASDLHVCLRSTLLRGQARFEICYWWTSGWSTALRLRIVMWNCKNSIGQLLLIKRAMLLSNH